MKIHCTNCGYEGKTKKYMKGSFAVEILLYFLFIFPGFIYTAWRHTSGSYKGCPDCRSETYLALSTWQKKQAQRKHEETMKGMKAL